MVKVKCTLHCCSYFRRSYEKDMVECGNPEKNHYLTDKNCPLYNFDWGKAKDRYPRFRKGIEKRL